jgi:hypothetical protein
MGTRILVVGVPRSGTSLTRRIFAGHPEVHKMLFEKWVLNKTTTRAEAIKRYPFLGKKESCGEKVINIKRVIGKIGMSDRNIVDYCKKWNKYFGEESRIIHIIRHPFDCLNSLVRSKKRFPRGPGFKSAYQEYLNYIPQFTSEIANLPNCLTVKYENLLADPDKVIRKLYSYCGLDYSYKFREVIKKGRAFNYKGKGLLFEYDSRLEKVIEVFNQFGDPRYDL